MKQTIVDVLMYLFENFIGEDMPLDPEKEYVMDKLEQLGFSKHEINQAFDWLEDLAIQQLDEAIDLRAHSTTRVYSQLENMLLDSDGIGFLMELEQTGILTPVLRELIMDRVIALDSELDTEQLKWIVLIVLYSQPGEEKAYTWMENLVFDQNMNYMH